MQSLDLGLEHLAWS